MHGHEGYPSEIVHPSDAARSPDAEAFASPYAQILYDDVCVCSQLLSLASAIVGVEIEGCFTLPSG